MELDIIIKFITDYGLSMTISVIAIYFGCKFLNVFLNTYKKNTEDTLIKNPLNNDFFTTLDRVLNYKIKTIGIFYKGKECKGRKKLFTDMLCIKLNMWRKNILDSLNTIQSGKYTDEQVKDILLKGFDKIVSDYEYGWIQEGIPKIVIDKFHKWHSGKCNMIIETIIEIYKGNSFSSQKEKLNAVLIGYNFLLLATIFDAETTLGELNGDLSGTEYKGLIIE